MRAQSDTLPSVEELLSDAKGSYEGEMAVKAQAEVSAIGTLSWVA